MAAQRNDDEYIAELVDAGVDITKPPSEWSDEHYTPVLARMDDLVDAIGVLVHLKRTQMYRNPGRFSPIKRPGNAVSRHSEYVRVKRHESLLDEVAQARERRRQRTA